jgi:hypothetical protein
MQYFDTPDPKRLFRAGILISLALMALLIIVLAVTSEDPVSAPRGAPPVSSADLAVTEQIIPLTDGRSVLCLVFTAPVRQTACDWTGASR